MIRKSIIFILLLFFQKNHSQEPYSININRKDGLPTTNVYASFQDKNNFMWFATDMGVIKYNGFTFKHFSTDDGLSDNENFNFFEDSKGRMWFNSYNGKLSFFQNNKFYNEKNTKKLAQLKDLGLIIQISENSHGDIIITYRNGTIYTLNLNSNGSYLTFEQNPIYFTLQNGNYFTSRGICNKYGKCITPFINIKNISNFNIKNFKFKNKHYFAYNNKVFVIENNQIKKITEFDFKNNEIISLFIDSKSMLWIGTRDGVFEKNLDKWNAKTSCYFKGNTVSSVNEDFENNIWITTLENGIYFLPNRNTSILNDQNNQILNINCLSKDKFNTLWAGSNDNDYFAIKNSSVANFKATSTSKPNNIISQIYHTNQKTVVIGNHAIQIKDNKSTNTIQFVGGRCFLEDIEGNYWLGASYLFKLKPNYFQKLTNLGLLSTNSSVMIANKTTSLIQNKEFIWAGTNKGIFCLENRKTINISKQFPETATAISDLYFQESTQNLIAGSNSKGIFVFKNNKLIKHISKKNGLSSNTIYAIKKGFLDNSVLVCNNFGIDAINFKAKNYTVKNLNSTFGIEGTKINDVEIIGDNLYIASDNGLLVVNYKNLKQNTIKPKIVIERFVVENKNYYLSKNKRFNYNQNDITISYIGLSYKSQKNIQYQFKLLGSDKKWTRSKSSEINYKSLSPGKYEFVVYCVNSSTIYSNPAKISFIINKPFWSTYPFMFLVGAILIAIGYYFWKQKEHSIKRKFEIERNQIQSERDKANIEKQIIALEQKALRMQMNPHFIFNALNTIKGYYSEGNDEKAGDFISKFSTLLRMLLENTEQIIPLSTEIKMLYLYIDLTKIRYKNAFEYKIEVDPAIHQDEVAIPMLLLQPIVENAIIHGLSPKKGHGFLLVSFYKKGKQLECVVKDNGIGRIASAEKQKHKLHESKAIEITKERLNLLENDENIKADLVLEDLLDDNNNSTGTLVTINIPYKNIW